MVKKKTDDLIITKSPKSRFAEAIKSVRTNLAFANIDKDNKVILITSCSPNDGKSFISANLAAAYAEEGKKVLLVDCDLRKGRQHNIFKIQNNINGGYSYLILNYKKYDLTGLILTNFICPTKIPNLSLLPCGPYPPNPTELLSSHNNEELINKLKEIFDIIILDSTPVLGLSDTVIMTKYSDANLLVVENNKTKIEYINRAKKMFKNANADITGVIVNKIDAKGNYGSYYNDSYYGDK